jgi:acetoin utilization protein AcuB
MTVRDLMTRQPVTIQPSETCQEAVRRMHAARVRHLPVVDGEGHLVGIVTDRDVRHHLFSPAAYRDLGTVRVDALLRQVPVSHIMSWPVITAGPDDDVPATAAVMLERKLGALPVVERERVVGIVTETDLLRQLCRADAAGAASAPEIVDVVVSYP